MEQDTPMTRTPEQLTAERGSTHGDYPTMSRCVMDVMRVYQNALNWDSLPDTVQVFLFNNAQKCARILTGNPYERDHYDDVAGYAHLAAKSVAPRPEVVPCMNNPEGGISLDTLEIHGGSISESEVVRSGKLRVGGSTLFPGRVGDSQPTTIPPDTNVIDGDIPPAGSITTDRIKFDENFHTIPSGVKIRNAVDGDIEVAGSIQARKILPLAYVKMPDGSLLPVVASGHAETAQGSSEAPDPTTGAPDPSTTALETPTETQDASLTPAETAPTPAEGDAGLAPLTRPLRSGETLLG